jgi:hypothetical protein
MDVNKSCHSLTLTSSNNAIQDLSKNMGNQYREYPLLKNRKTEGNTLRILRTELTISHADKN